MSKQTQELFEAHTTAVEYVSKIGRPQPHFREDSKGYLHTLDISTQIGHQEYTGAQNYWKDRNFDKALEKVVRENFADLANKALQLMESNAVDSLLAEEQTLKARLAVIQEHKAKLEQGEHHE